MILAWISTDKGLPNVSQGRRDGGMLAWADEPCTKRLPWRLGTV